MNIEMKPEEIEEILTKAYEAGSFSVIHDEYIVYDDYSVSMRATEYAEKILIKTGLNRKGCFIMTYEEAFEIISNNGYDCQITYENKIFCCVPSPKEGHPSSYYILPKISSKTLADLVLGVINFTSKNKRDIL